MSTNPRYDHEAADFAARVRANQRKLAANIQHSYDFVVCGSGSSGSVVARRLAENAAVNVLLLEAGGTDEVPSVMEPGQWSANLGTERDWGFRAKANPRLNGRCIPLPMGKVLGGGSSINAMAWARGHRNDWDYFAAEADDDGWNYKSVLAIYRRIEDWAGEPDPVRRGTGGLIYVEPAYNPNPIAPALLDAARSVGIPTFNDHNGRMMECDGGSSIINLRIREGRRLSIFRTYTYPYMDRPNLTVLTGAHVTRVTIVGSRAVGVEFSLNGRAHRVGANREVVLSLGAVNTPKVLMQSGIGDENELKRVGIGLLHHLAGVGQNFQDHPMVAACVWEYQEPIAPRNNGGEATLIWKSDPALHEADLQFLQAQVANTTAETAHYAPPPASWSLMPALVRPKSRGRLRLTGSSPHAPLEIDANMLADPADLRALMTGLALCREIGNSAALRPFVKREVMPGDLKGKALETFVRDGTTTLRHQSCTAKMGHDPMAVVNGQLQVHGIESLRIADSSVMPRITTGNTMAPCVIIGERAAELLKARYRI
jgi:choline dehydrogenase